MSLNRMSIVGKGPSITKLTADDFPPGPIIVMNEAIEVIEKIPNLNNIIISHQQDGLSRCMRLPQKKDTILYLSQKSKEWFPNYSPRHVYDKVQDYNLDEREPSVVVSIEIARSLCATEITFFGMDACTCGEQGYYDDRLWMDPKNLEENRFQTHCSLAALQLRGLDCRWHIPGKGFREQRAGLFSVVTPTGDRPEALSYCRDYIVRSTVLPLEWIVVDDGKYSTEAQARGSRYFRRERRNEASVRHTLARNLKFALEQVTTNFVIIVEDDDWYHPTYLEKMFDFCGIVDLVGEVPCWYYSLQGNSYRANRNENHASLCQTAFSSTLFPFVRNVCQSDEMYVDLKIWSQCPVASRQLVTFKQPLCVGIKGMPGRKGLSAGWKNPSANWWTHDTNRKKIKELLGNDYSRYNRWCANNSAQSN